MTPTRRAPARPCLRRGCAGSSSIAGIWSTRTSLLEPIGGEGRRIGGGGGGTQWRRCICEKSNGRQSKWARGETEPSGGTLNKKKKDRAFRGARSKKKKTEPSGGTLKKQKDATSGGHVLKQKKETRLQGGTLHKKKKRRAFRGHPQHELEQLVALGAAELVLPLRALRLLPLRALRLLTRI